MLLKKVVREEMDFYHKLLWENVRFRDTSPSDSEAITPREQRSKRRGGRNEPAGSAYRTARNRGTAEETSGTFLRSWEFSAEMEAKVHKTQFLSQPSGIFALLLCGSRFFLSKSTELWDLSILSSQPTRPSPLDIFNNDAASQKKVLPKILIFKPYFRTSTSQLLFWFGHEFLGSALHQWSRGPGAAPTISELIPFTRYQPRASHSFSEQNQAFALALALCAINNSQQTGSVPGKTVEWTISSKHRMCLLGVSECWCIPAEPVSCPMNQTPLLNHRYPTSDATFSCFLLYNIATKVFR